MWSFRQASFGELSFQITRATKSKCGRFIKLVAAADVVDDMKAVAHLPPA